MYTAVAVWATIATPLPMWGVGDSGMDLLPNMVTDFRGSSQSRPFLPLFHRCIDTCGFLPLLAHAG
jgi:hypothetical protein